TPISERWPPWTPSWRRSWGRSWTAARSRRWWWSPPITARRWAITASRPTASSPTRPRSRCRWWSGGRAWRRGGAPPPRGARPARLVHVVPPVLQAAGPPERPGPPRRPGRSLLGPPAAGDSSFESLSATLNRGWAPLRGLLRGGTKFIALPLPEVYDLPKDP